LTSLDALFAAVYAAPDDDEPRLVLADRLQEEGDPRGEFITLQIEGKDAARQRKLESLYGRSWLGRLDGEILPGGRFRRGFLAEATYHHYPKEREEWATVEVLTIGPSAIIPGTARALLEVREVAGVTLNQLMKRPPRLRRLHIRNISLARWQVFVESRGAAELVRVEELPADALIWRPPKLAEAKLVDEDGLTDDVFRILRETPGLHVESRGFSIVCVDGEPVVTEPEVSPLAGFAEDVRRRWRRLFTPR
jgi:uncharacterized protein (TIGR02996 family)